MTADEFKETEHWAKVIEYACRDYTRTISPLSACSKCHGSGQVYDDRDELGYRVNRPCECTKATVFPWNLRIVDVVRCDSVFSGYFYGPRQEWECPECKQRSYYKDDGTFSLVCRDDHGSTIGWPLLYAIQEGGSVDGGEKVFQTLNWSCVMGHCLKLDEIDKWQPAYRTSYYVDVEYDPIQGYQARYGVSVDGKLMLFCD